MSNYRDYEITANRTEDGSIELAQVDGLDDGASIILLTPDQLVRLGEWAKSWAKRESR